MQGVVTIVLERVAYSIRNTDKVFKLMESLLEEWIVEEGLKRITEPEESHRRS